MSRTREYLQDMLRHTDGILLALCIAASGFGVVMIYSATRYMETNRLAVVQAVAALIGVVLFLLVQQVDLNEWMKKKVRLWIWLTIANFGLIALLLTPLGIGDDTGNKAWLDFKFLPVNVQPAEIIKVLFIVVLGALMVPLQVTFVPIYVLISKLGWMNSFPGLIIPHLVSAYFIFMLRQNFMSVDNSYLEAGMLDGMGRIQSIIYVLCPMCKPTLITVSIITFINGWNSYFWPKMITTSDFRRTIAVGINHGSGSTELQRNHGGRRTGHHAHRSAVPDPAEVHHDRPKQGQHEVIPDPKAETL